MSASASRALDVLGIDDAEMQGLDVFDELELAAETNVFSVFEDPQDLELVFIGFEKSFGARDDFHAACAAAGGATAKGHVGVGVLIGDINEAGGSVYTDFELSGVESNLRHGRNLALSGTDVHAKLNEFHTKPPSTTGLVG